MKTNIEIDGTIRVCAWCLPGETVFDVHPEWRDLGLRLSHGICEHCRDSMDYRRLIDRAGEEGLGDRESRQLAWLSDRELHQLAWLVNRRLEPDYYLAH